MLKPKATTVVAKQDLCQWQLSYFSLTLEDRCSETRFVFCVRYLVWCMLFFINPRLHPILYCYILLVYINFQETKKQTNNIGILWYVSSRSAYQLYNSYYNMYKTVVTMVIIIKASKLFTQTDRGSCTLSGREVESS